MGRAAVRLFRRRRKLIISVDGALAEDQLAALRERLDRALQPPVPTVSRAALVQVEGDPISADIEQWIRENPQKFGAWVTRYNRIHGRMPGRH